MVRTMRARDWFRWLLGAAPMVSLLLGTATPVEASTHCGKAATHSASAPAAPHSHLPNSTPAPFRGDCPHCPPAGCAVSAACVGPALGAVVPMVGTPGLRSGSGRFLRVEAEISIGSIQPPTPPPQGSVAIV